MKYVRIIAVLLMALVLSGITTGCKSKEGEGPVEQAGKAIDKTVEKVDDKLKGVAADTKKTVKHTAEEVKDSVKD